MLELMKQRHSVRQYTDKKIEPGKRAALDKMIEEINQNNGLHIQIFYEEPKCFDSMMAHYGKFSGVKSYIALVGKKSETLEKQLGYQGERLVLKAQELGLNTCWLAMTHGKSKAEIGKDEKQVPEWFLKGMEAALLAPTAMNQQKFFFELLPDGQVKASSGRGFYTKLDLEIVKYHFEEVSGKNVQ